MRLNIFNIATLKHTDDKNLKLRTINLINVALPKINMNQFPKILVASPTYDVMKYCQNEFFNAIKYLDYPNYDILIVDNSEKEDYFNEIKNMGGFTVLKENSSEQNRILRLIDSRNKILEYAIKNNYDHLLMLDSDVILPKDCLKELLNCNKDIVSGLYYNYFIVDGKTQWLPVAWTELSEEDFQEIKKKVNLPESFTSKDLRVHMTLEEADSNKLVGVIIPSAGCMLISKNVFSRLRYGPLSTNNYNNIQTSDEIKFLLEARKLGFKAYVNTKIKCEHLVNGKFEKKGNTYIHPMFKK